MNTMYETTNLSFSNILFASLLLFALALIWPRDAQAQSYLMPDNDTFATIIEQLSTADTEGAEASLDALPRAARNADYHYLRSVLAMQSMNDAGAFRMARLARQMKGHLEDAIDMDPNHQLAHFGLMQFHRFAPGIMGGRERQLEFHQQRLVDLDSVLQFPAALTRAQVEEDEDAQREIFHNWIAHSPQMFGAHYGYLTSLIGWGEYEQAKHAITEAFTHADDEQVQMIQYQQVRMAALAGLEDALPEEDNTVAHKHSEQAWFTEAYLTGLALLADESLSEQIDQAWLNMRLAQVEWALQYAEKAQARVQQLLTEQPGERLHEEAVALQSRLNGAEG